MNFLPLSPPWRWRGGTESSNLLITQLVPVATSLYPSVQFSSVSQSCPTLWDPMNCSLPDSAVHGIFQVRILEWVVISFSRGFSQPINRTSVSYIILTSGRFFTLAPAAKSLCGGHLVSTPICWLISPSVVNDKGDANI